VRDIELPHPVVHTDPGIKKTPKLEGATVHHTGGIAGDQDEDLRSISEHHRLKCKRRQDVVWEMIEKDAEEGETAEKIKPEIALHGRRMTRDGHQINSRKKAPMLPSNFAWLTGKAEQHSAKHQ
jgi:hypothetical protein